MAPALCTFGARQIHKLDTAADIRLCPIRTERGQALLLANGLDPLDPDSWLFIADGSVWRDSDAMIRVGERCGGWGRVLSLIRLVPRPMRDWLHARIARNRYAVFGRGDICALPDRAPQARLVS